MTSPANHRGRLSGSRNLYLRKKWLEPYAPYFFTLVFFSFLFKDEINFLIGDFDFKSASLFIGAFLAFFFNFLLLESKKYDRQAAYIKYCVALLTHANSNILNTYFQIIKIREQDYQILRNYLNTGNNNIVLGTLGVKILNGDKGLYIDFNEISFLAKYDPNVIILLKDTINVYGDFFKIIDEYNLCLDRIHQTTQNINPADIVMLASCYEMLLKHTQSVLYLTNKSASVLISGLNLFYDNNGCKGIDRHSLYDLDIIPIESYEEAKFW